MEEITLWTKCMYEFIGTLILIFMGNGVVASNLLNKSKGQNGGWIVNTVAWGIAVMIGVFIAGPFSGAHFNPALSMGFAITGTFPWSYVLPYTLAQCFGGFCGAVLVYVFYKDHYDATEDKDLKLGTFCTMPAIHDKPRNLLCEALATAVLTLVVCFLGTKGNTPEVGFGAIGALPTAFLIMGIGMCLGGTTGYAINPARDLPPRVAHAILPIKDKRDSGWDYSWIPIVGPTIGAALGALLFIFISHA